MKHMYQYFLNCTLSNKLFLSPSSGCHFIWSHCCSINIVSDIIYRAKITWNKITKQYLGSTANTFKQRYRNHKSSFNNINKRHTTELANYIWNLTNKNTYYKPKWEVLNRIKSKFNTKFGCKLCNLENKEIDKSDKDTTLNIKSERQNICIHYQKYFF